jgi:hypothetical protein
MAHRKMNSQRIAKQWVELAVAAPQVVMHRTSRMATAGVELSDRDRTEFARMSSEKVMAFYQSWMAMSTAAFAVQFELARAFSNAAAAVATGSQASAMSTVTATSNAATKVLSAGLGPVHKKAVANARRLSRHKK